jgi:hypothetical protein
MAGSSSMIMMRGAGMGRKRRGADGGMLTAEGLTANLR